MDMPRPGAVHKKLADLAGTWDGDERMHPSPWTPKGSNNNGVVTAAIKSDDFFLISNYMEHSQDGENWAALMDATYKRRK